MHTTQDDADQAPHALGGTMRHTATITAALLLAALTAGCSSDTDKPTVSKATDTPSPASSSPSPTPTRERYKLGDTVNISNAGTEFTVTALSFKDQGITSLPGMLSSGEKWAVVEVKVCNTGSQVFSVSPFPWSLAYADGARVQGAGVSGAGLPAPEYPVDAKVPGGDCVRGNIPFEVPKSGRAERVLYGPEDLEEPVEWAVDKG